VWPEQKRLCNVSPAVRGRVQGETARYRKSINVASSFQHRPNRPTVSRKAYQAAGERYDLVMHDSTHAPPLYARIPVTRHRPRCWSCMSDLAAQRHAVFSSARAMPNQGSNLLLPLDKAWGGQQTHGHSLSELSRGEVCGCFAPHLAWVHLKLLHQNAWFCLGARGLTWQT
jgi:hypothetical protein